MAWLRIEAVGAFPAFEFRAPVRLEWRKVHRAQVAHITAQKANTAEAGPLCDAHLAAFEELASRTCTSHTAEELNALDELHFGLLEDLGTEVFQKIEKEREAAGKAPAPSSPTSG